MLDPPEIHHLFQDVKFTKSSMDLLISYTGNSFGSRKNNSKLVGKIDSVTGNIKKAVTTAANF